MLIKLFTRAPVVGIDKMSDFLTVLTKVTTNKSKTWNARQICTISVYSCSSLASIYFSQTRA